VLNGPALAPPPPLQPVRNADFIIPVEIDGTPRDVYVLKRPHVDEFMRRMGELFEIVVFTASLSKVPCAHASCVCACVWVGGCFVCVWGGASVRRRCRVYIVYMFVVCL
jgi:hypothetical protein